MLKAYLKYDNQYNTRFCTYYYCSVVMTSAKFFAQPDQFAGIKCTYDINNDLKLLDSSWDGPLVRAAYLTSIVIPLQLDPNLVEMDLNLIRCTAIWFITLVKWQMSIMTSLIFSKICHWKPEDVLMTTWNATGHDKVAIQYQNRYFIAHP